MLCAVRGMCAPVTRAILGTAFRVIVPISTSARLACTTAMQWGTVPPAPTRPARFCVRFPSAKRGASTRATQTLPAGWCPTTTTQPGRQGMSVWAIGGIHSRMFRHWHTMPARTPPQRAVGPWSTPPRAGATRGIGGMGARHASPTAPTSRPCATTFRWRLASTATAQAPHPPANANPGTSTRGRATMVFAASAPWGHSRRGPAMRPAFRATRATTGLGVFRWRRGGLRACAHLATRGAWSPTHVRHVQRGQQRRPGATTRALSASRGRFRTWRGARTAKRVQRTRSMHETAAFGGSASPAKLARHIRSPRRGACCVHSASARRGTLAATACLARLARPDSSKT
mmetsp:Transcript_33412/g.81475  ORF Transcript_33412/g.81475 Transcript_33412/m.81475 type:complete len:344 (-) Transcript_33412:4583-5614(-)